MHLIVASLGSFSPVIMVDLNETNGIVYITLSIDVSYIGLCKKLFFYEFEV